MNMFCPKKRKPQPLSFQWVEDHFLGQAFRLRVRGKNFHLFCSKPNASNRPLDSGGGGCGDKRMHRNSVLIRTHMNPTCSTVKLDEIIMMSEFSQSAGQQLVLLATAVVLTHVAFWMRAPMRSVRLVSAQLKFPALGCGQNFGSPYIWLENSWNEMQAPIYWPIHCCVEVLDKHLFACNSMLKILVNI